MYAVHLSQGQTLFFRQIRVQTLKNYIRDAAGLLGMASPSRLDPRYDSPNDTRVCPMLHSFFASRQAFEKGPNQREPFTLEMLRHAQSIAAEADLRHGARVALTDWFIVGLSAGLRLSEWAQTGAVGSRQFHTNIFGDIYAFRPSDLRIATINGQYSSGLDILGHSLDSIHRLWILWRAQKNGHHHEERLFVRNATPGGHCCVAALYRILQRYHHLLPASLLRSSDHIPLAVFDRGVPLGWAHLTAAQIEQYMRALAVEVYQLSPSKHKSHIQKWSSHSLRVGGCVLLHAMGFDAPQIKWLLRWRSDAYLAYLRNTTVLSTQQNEAFDKAAAMPHFI